MRPWTDTREKPTYRNRIDDMRFFHRPPHILLVDPKLPSNVREHARIPRLWDIARPRNEFDHIVGTAKQGLVANHPDVECARNFVQKSPLAAILAQSPGALLCCFFFPGRNRFLVFFIFPGRFFRTERMTISADQPAVRRTVQNSYLQDL